MVARNREAEPKSLTPPELADELGEVKAAIAELTGRERALKDALIATNIAEIEGERYRAAITIYDRVTLDMEAARKKLGEVWCQRHSKMVHLTVVRVSARKRVA